MRGYPDDSVKEGRINFGDIYAVGRGFHADTDLKLKMQGFDAAGGKVIEMEGWLALVDPTDDPAVTLHFHNILTTGTVNTPKPPKTFSRGRSWDHRLSPCSL